MSPAAATLFWGVPSSPCSPETQLPWWGWGQAGMGQVEREDPAPLTANMGVMPPQPLALPSLVLGTDYSSELFLALPGSALPTCWLLLSQLH